MTVSRQVVIVGGGVAGQAAAQAMHRRGIPVLILESRAGLPDARLGVNLPGNAMRALEALGLADELRQKGSPVRRREYRDERGRLLFAVDESEFWGRGAESRRVRRSDLVELLGRGLPDQAFRREHRVVSVRQSAGDGAGSVTAVLADGSVEQSALPVGADGVHSAVRREVFGGHAPRAALLSDTSWCS